MMTPPFLNDTTRMDSVDSDLFSAIKKAGENREQLSEAIANRTIKEVRAAVEVMLSEDPTRCRQALVIGILIKSKSLVNLAMKRADQNPYYSTSDRNMLTNMQKNFHKNLESKGS